MADYDKVSEFDEKKEDWDQYSMYMERLEMIFCCKWNSSSHEEMRNLGFSCQSLSYTIQTVEEFGFTRHRSPLRRLMRN